MSRLILSLTLSLLTTAALAAEPGQASVKVESTRDGVEVREVVLSTASPDAPLIDRLPRIEPRCTAPCAFDLAAGERTLQFGGGRWPVGRKTLELEPGAQAHLTVRPGSKAMKAVGGSLLVGGTVVSLVGLIGMAASDEKGPFFGVTGGGLVTLLVGLPFAQAGKTKVRVRF